MVTRLSKIWNAGIKLKIGFGFAIILIVLVGTQYGLNKSIANVIASQEELSASTSLSTEIESIKSSVCFFESKVKGYVLTGNESLLENNKDYLSTIVSQFSNLKKYAPNKEQLVCLDALVFLLNEEIQFSDEVIFQYQLNPKKAVDLIKLGRGKILMNEIFAQFEKIHSIEQAKFSEIVVRNKYYSALVKKMDSWAYLFAFLLVIISVWVLYRDINKRQKLEADLVISQKKAEHATIIKEQFMANMSHEIRTPLNAILGFNNRLNKTNLSGEQQEYANAVQSSGENLLAIVNDILDFSKIEAGMVRIEKICFNLPQLIDSVITMFLTQAKDKHVQLKLNASEDLPPLILGDPTRLTQILINLIGNALKFTDKGSVTLNVNCTPNDKHLVNIHFSIEDTGIGISEDKISEIFERFTQAKSDTSRIFGGTGLGLSIAKKLVELQAGTISVTSTKNTGSVFTFTIPYQIAIDEKITKKAVPEIVESVASKNKLKILVVEDNLLNQKLAGFMLKDWNYDFDICSNGKFAIEKLATEAYHLILMDIQMPEMNGYETTEYIREKLKLQLPIIAMTAHALPGEREKCISFGMTDYISKPIKEADLKNLIAKYIHQANTEKKLNTK